MIKKKKRVVSLILIFTLLMSMIPLPEIKIYAEKKGDWEYQIIDSDGIEIRITDYCGEDTKVTIPEKIDGKLVTSIGGYAFDGCSSLTSITIPKSVTSIGNGAFNGCTNLTSITIPDGVTSIRDFAFYGCNSLTSITIPESVTSIGDYAFDDCSSLTNITIPNSVTIIKASAFKGCSSLTNITIPESVTSINRYLFGGCSSLTNITIPESVTSIREGAFDGCTNLTSITIPESVTSIENSAFMGCSGLTSITIPESVTSIGDSAFMSCSSLTSIIVNNGNMVYDSRKSCNAIIETKSNMLIVGCKNTRIPESVTSIGGCAFGGCSSLTSITIPKSVASIEERAFYDCEGLKSITISESVTSIGDSAFMGCSSLTSIIIPKSVTSIGKGVFDSCSSLASITISNGVTSIEEGAFDGCTNLTSITIPESVTSIGNWAFYDCSALTIYGYPDSYAEKYAKENKIPFKGISGNGNSTTNTTTVQGESAGAASSKLKIGNNVEFAIPGDIPIIGDGTVSLDFSNIPVQYEQEGNTYKLSIGVSDLKKFNENDWFSFKKFVDTQKEDYKKGINMLLASKFGTATMGWSVKPQISCYGYAEGVITKDGIQSCEGKMMIEIKVKANKEWQTTVVVVPVVIKASGEVGMKTTTSIGFDFANGYIYTEGEVDFILPKIKLSAGVGIAYIADVSVYGSLENKVTLTQKTTSSGGNDVGIKAALTGEAGISAKALFLKYEKALCKGTWEYYNSTQGRASVAAYVANRAGSSNVLLQAEDYRLERTESKWIPQKEGKRSLEGRTSVIETLATDVYQDAAPVLAETESGVKVLVYTADIAKRSDGNHTAVVYSLYDEDTSTWSSPVIVEDDGTADFYPSVSVNGEEVIVAWSNSNKIFTKEETKQESFLNDLSASCEIETAILNVATGNITTKTLTDNEKMDIHPSVSVADGTVLVTWNQNNNNDILNLTGKNQIYTAVNKEGNWTVSMMDEIQCPIMHVTAGNLQNRFQIAYVADTDGDLSTTSDRKLMVSDLEGNRNTIVENVACGNPCFAEINGKKKLIYYVGEEIGGSLYSVDVVNAVPEKWTDNSISSDYCIVAGEDSQILLYTDEKMEGEGRDLYACLLNEGEVGNAIVLTDVEGYMESPAGIKTTDGYLTVFLKKEVQIGEEDITENADLSSLALTFTGKSELQAVTYEVETMLPGAETELLVKIKNNGLAECENCEIQVWSNSTRIGGSTVTEIASGEERNCPVSITLPDDMKISDVYEVRVISERGTVTETIQPGFMDVGLSVEETEGGYKATITNEGGFDADVSLKIQDTDGDGSVLEEYPLGNIPKGEYVEKTFTKEELQQYETDSLCMSITTEEADFFDCNNRSYLYAGEEIVKGLDYLKASKRDTSYEKGEVLDLQDLMVTAVYDNAEEQTVSGYTTNAGEIDMTTVGKKELVITYEENYTVRTVTMEIEVTGKGAENGSTDSSKDQTVKNNPFPIKIQSLKISAISKKLAAGKKVKLLVSITPQNASNRAIYWKSSNTKYAVVDAGGRVTLKKQGAGKTVTITATARDGSNKKATYKIKIMKHAVKSIKLKAKKTVKAGKSITIKPTVKTTGKKVNKTLKWTSSNTKYATVSSKGKVKTKKAGKGKTIKITASSTDGSNKKSSIKIKIK